MENRAAIIHRPRRLRRTQQLRSMLKECTLELSDLIQPLFVDEGIEESQEIRSLPGLFRIPEVQLCNEVEELYGLGIRAVMPFGVSHHKDEEGSDTWADEGLVSRMTRAIKSSCPEMIVVPDICFCEYTTHGHCGVLRDGDVDNDRTVENLVKQSLAAAKAGADMLAPSSMMDGQIGAIRSALDASGFSHVGLLAHAIKFASAFYGPFRTAVDCDLNGDRKSYQADYGNYRQALIEARLDEEEGADILMVKPGTPYLDVLSRLRTRSDLPLAVYQVGGEYAAIKFAALAGVINEKEVVMEIMAGYKRAGADVIVSYFTKQIAKWMKGTL